MFTSYAWLETNNQDLIHNIDLTIDLLWNSEVALCVNSHLVEAS